MKFIHTADWHLGNKMYDINRYSEYSNFFSWLKTEIEKENAQTLIVSGDIYDTANPPIESRTQYIQFLTSLINTCCKNVIIVGGNHDSGALLDSEKSILNLLNIHVIGSITNLKIEDMVFELYDQNNLVAGICCAVPYSRESELKQFFDGDYEDGTFSDNAYAVLYKKVLDYAKILQGGKQIPIIATGHLYAANLEGRLKDVNGEIKTDDGVRVLDIVGKLGSVHAKIFPKDFDYIALGHIHYTTMVDKNPKIRYSGSPFVMGFDEANIERNILSVEINSEHHLDVRKIPVPKTFDFKRISGTCKTIITELLKYENNPPLLPTYIEVFFIPEDGISIYDEIEKIEQKFPSNVFVVNKKANIPNPISGDFKISDMEELKNFDETEIFKKLILTKTYSLYANESEDEQKKTKEKLINKYLPLFLEIAGEENENL